MTRKPASPRLGLDIEIVVRSARWRHQPRAAATIRAAIREAAKAVSTPRAGLAIVLSHDSAVQALNRDWRGKNKPTNVLSFPSAPGPHPVPRGRSGPDGDARAPAPYIGDIVIAYQTTLRESVAENKKFNHHLAHLAIHGFLHLVGYDHETDGEAETMERMERRVLKRLAIADPYAARDA